MNKKKVFFWVSGIIIIILLFLALRSTGLIGIDLSSHGHGDYKQGSGESFLISLGIMDNYDYVDKFTDEAYCFNDDCWDVADDLYDDCFGEFGDDPVCDADYYDYLTTTCSVRCEEEVYVWDGSPVNDLSAFSEEAFPDFIANSRFSCEGWLFGGTWISTVDSVGCVDSWMVNCGSNKMISAGSVCETIGFNWRCGGGSAVCSND